MVFKLHIDCTRNADGSMTNDKGRPLACSMCRSGLICNVIIAFPLALPGSCCCKRLRSHAINV